MEKNFLLSFTLISLIQISTVLTVRGEVTINGTIDGSLPSGNRITDTGSLNPAICGLTAPTSFNTGLNYQVYEIRTTVSEPLKLSFLSATFDPFAALYCSPFNPASPQAGLLFSDDDSGGYPLPSFSSANNIQLAPNTSYFLVISSYSNSTPTGNYSFTLGGNASIVTYPLTVNISGTGNVNSTPGGIACTGSTCNANYNYSTTVTLNPSSSGSNLFTGWSGDCSGTDICTVSMTTAHSVTATFIQAPAKILGGLIYPSLLTAYSNVATSGDTIQLYQGMVASTFTANMPRSVKISGGYDSGFTTNASTSTLQGKVSIQQGKVTFDKVNVK